MISSYKILIYPFCAFFLSTMLLSCVFFHTPSIEEQWEMNERDFRKDLDVLYPPQMSRDDMILQRGKPRKTAIVDQENIKNLYVEICVNKIKKELLVTPVLYDFYWTSRMGYVPTPAGSGLWGDYIFYDENNKIIKAYRQFLD